MFRHVQPAAAAVCLCCFVLAGAGCGSSDDDAVTDTTTDNTDEPTAAGGTADVQGNFDAAMFDDALQAVEQVDCTLDSGTTTTCLQLTFASNPVGDTDGMGAVGPHCPESVTTPRDEAGFGVYDGATTPGFQPMVDAAVAMDADGHDIVNDDGTINVDDLSGGAQQGLSYCLEAPFDSTLSLAFLIPIEPEFRSEPWDVGTVSSVGVGVSGVPFKGYTPSVTVAEADVGGTGSGNIPSLDHCGGHPDPAGYYHWHLVPQGTNTVLASDTYDLTGQYGITCSNPNVAFDAPASFPGLAKDGFPLYGPFDAVDGVAGETGQRNVLWLVDGDRRERHVLGADDAFTVLETDFFKPEVEG